MRINLVGECEKEKSILNELVTGVLDQYISSIRESDPDLYRNLTEKCSGVSILAGQIDLGFDIEGCDELLGLSEDGEPFTVEKSIEL